MSARLNAWPSPMATSGPSAMPGEGARDLELKVLLQRDPEAQQHEPPRLRFPPPPEPPCDPAIAQQQSCQTPHAGRKDQVRRRLKVGGGEVDCVDGRSEGVHRPRWISGEALEPPDALQTEVDQVADDAEQCPTVKNKMVSGPIGPTGWSLNTTSSAQIASAWKATGPTVSRTTMSHRIE